MIKLQKSKCQKSHKKPHILQKFEVFVSKSSNLLRQSNKVQIN